MYYIRFNLDIGSVTKHPNKLAECCRNTNFIYLCQFSRIVNLSFLINILNFRA